MKKYFLAAVIVCVCAFGFSGCEADSVSEDNPYEKTSIEKKRTRNIKTGKSDSQEYTND